MPAEKPKAAGSSASRLFALPSLTGFKNHDPTKSKAPSYTLSGRCPRTKQHVSPGPAHFVPSNITKNGRDGTPAFSFGRRRKEPARAVIPAPNCYSLENAEKYTHRSSPAYTLATRRKQHANSNQAGPGPASNMLPPVMGPKTVNIAAGPAHTILGRSKVGNFFNDLSKSPGPAAYQSTDLKTYLRKSPEYSMPGRKFPPQSSTRTPAPGVYCPEKVTSNASKAPAFTFGRYHSEKTIIPLTALDKSQQSITIS
ncbi:ciliary microtubule associated protein 1B [Nerophis lumbriciformis]|uniref:ciliary microtubule associated protein 1B n=1 Tax=Nerophis lumbriciformis TaxID=546530 RepID=UPI002ADF5DC2|nr:ciliary microtubule associated protein 1B-like [Nerophis lumbriciformis]